MKAGVIGLGKFGINVVLELYQQGGDVLAIDKRKDLVQRAGQFSSRAVTADGTDSEVLASLGVNSLDVVVISMGSNLSGAILAAMYVKELGVSKVIVKVADEDHARVLKKVGATQVIFPEQEMARKLARNIYMPNLLEYVPISDDYAIMEIVPPKQFISKTIQELDLRKKYKITVLAIRNADTDHVSLVMSPKRAIDPVDRLVLLGKQTDLDQVKGMTSN